MDNLDLIYGSIFLCVFLALLWILLKARERQSKQAEESIPDFPKLMSAFMRGNGKNLTNMTQDKIEMKVSNDDGSEEHLSIIQEGQILKFYWSKINSTSTLRRVFQFDKDEAEENIMEKIASGITEEKERTN